MLQIHTHLNVGKSRKTLYFQGLPTFKNLPNSSLNHHINVDAVEHQNPREAKSAWSKKRNGIITDFNSRHLSGEKIIPEIDHQHPRHSPENKVDHHFRTAFEGSYHSNRRKHSHNPQYTAVYIHLHPPICHRNRVFHNTICPGLSIIPHFGHLAGQISRSRTPKPCPLMSSSV